MRISKATLLFAISLFAIALLIAFQINWMKQSRNLIESQFNQKVSLALGSAVSYINNHKNSDLKVQQQEYATAEMDLVYIDGEDGKVSIYDKKELDRVLGSWLKVYDIKMEYHVDIIDERTQEQAKIREYTCSISPLAKGTNDYRLAVSFPGKSEYISDKMNYQLYSSILILLFISAVFFLINYAFLKQKKITENNIEFFNNTAHEFKTPLTNIILANKLLMKREPVLGDNRYTNIVSKEGSKLMRQIKRVLHLSQMENGQYELKKEIFDLSGLVSEVVDDMSVLIEENGGKVVLQIPDNTYTVTADRYHLGNVFRNLIDNSLKYCTEDPLIQISLKEEKEGISLTFEDNGIGISKMDQKHIFQKFQRVNTGDIHDAKGFGIGLSYVKTVLELHKGFIKIFSDLNKGSRFDLYLPKV